MEQYKLIKDFPNYEISNCGNIRNVKTLRILKGGINSGGYKFVILHKQNISIHRCVAITFLENLTNENCVDHKDRNRLNNNVENLQWVSRSENSINSTRPSKNKYRGIWSIGDKWRATINIKNKAVHIGIYETEDDAYNGRCKYINDNNLSLNYIK